jgi:hypothetical protein
LGAAGSLTSLGGEQPSDADEIDIVKFTARLIPDARRRLGFCEKAERQKGDALQLPSKGGRCIVMN